MMSEKLSYEALFSLGKEALAQGHADVAYGHWLNCKAHLHESVAAYRELANAFRSIGHLTEAEAITNTAIQHVPENLALHADYANILLDRGNAAEAVKLWSNLAADARRRGDVSLALSLLSNALMGLEYADNISTSEKLETANLWGELAVSWAALSVEPSATKIVRKWQADANQVLRVGFISGDLCDHPVGFLLLPLLQHRTPNKWVPYIYDNGSRCDRTHQQLRTVLPDDQWRNILPLDDHEAIEMILADELDFLIDLSGHTGRNRLRLMALKLAKYQLSWLGYSGTTGLSTIDAIILDESIGSGYHDRFTEKVIYLNPSRFCFRPPFTPPLIKPPCETNGFVTFGSFNNTAKYNPTLLHTWAKILKGVPDSKLILKWRTFADLSFCETTLNCFAKHGIDPQRIELRPFSPHRAMLNEYNDVDIALDTFPFCGGYTSLEALWMGLPLVTVAGDSPIARQSESFLRCLGKTSWVGSTIHEYVQIAQELAQDGVQLSTTRDQQRYQIMDSPLHDALGFAQAFESLLTRFEGNRP